MPLQHLVTDILLRILAFVDFYTLLSFSRTNRLFREVCFTKQLWIFQLRKLCARRLLDLPVDEACEALSTDQLLGTIKHAICGSRAWSPAQFEYTPRSIRYVDVPSSYKIKEIIPELLPGGRYIVIHFHFPFHNSVECWEVSGGRRLWRYEQPSYYVQDTVFDIRSDGATATAAIIAMGPGNLEHLLVVVEIDLSTGSSQELFRLSFRSWDTAHRPQICGRYLVHKLSVQVPGTSSSSSFLLINWETSEFVTYGPFRDSTSANIIREYVIIAFAAFESNALQVRLYSLTSLDHCWRPISNFDPTIFTPEQNIAPSLSFTLPESQISLDENGFVLDISSAESPFLNGVYEFVFHVRNLQDPPPSLSSLSQFENFRRHDNQPKYLWDVEMYRGQFVGTDLSLHAVLKTTVRYEDITPAKRASSGVLYSRLSGRDGNFESRRERLAEWLERAGVDAARVPSGAPHGVFFSNTGSALVLYGQVMVVLY